MDFLGTTERCGCSVDSMRSVCFVVGLSGRKRRRSFHCVYCIAFFPPHLLQAHISSYIRPAFFVFFALVRVCAGQVMSGMEKQIADLSSREESNTGIAKESKQKVREKGRQSSSEGLSTS